MDSGLRVKHSQDSQKFSIALECGTLSHAEAFRSIPGWGSQATFLNSSDLPSFEHLRCPQKTVESILKCTPVKSCQN